jgi:hypothetical protein
MPKMDASRLPGASKWHGTFLNSAVLLEPVEDEG